MVDRRDSTRASGLTDDEVAIVLARAAELDRRGRPDQPRLVDGAVEQIAVEAGIDGSAVRRALAELRAGALPVAGAARGRLSPARSVRVEREVRGPRPAVERELRGWLHRQLFHEVRTFGNRTRYARRRGLLADMQRGLDLRGRLVLRRVQWVEVAVVDGPSEGSVLVCLEADCARGTGAHRALLWGGGALGTGAVVAAGVAADPALLALAPVGALAGGGAGHLAGRSVHARHAGAVTTALAGRLDRLERRS